MRDDDENFYKELEALETLVKRFKEKDIENIVAFTVAKNRKIGILRIDRNLNEMQAVGALDYLKYMYLRLIHKRDIDNQNEKERIKDEDKDS